MASKKDTVYRGQKIIDAALMLVFATLLVLATRDIGTLVNTIRAFSALDIAALIFATFRLIQLLMLDNVTQWFRDFFYNTKVHSIGADYDVDKEKLAQGVRREVAILLGCPWCTSVWTSLAVLYTWIVWPAAHLFVYVMALSGVGTILYIAIKKLEKEY